MQSLMRGTATTLAGHNVAFTASDVLGQGEFAVVYQVYGQDFSVRTAKVYCTAADLSKDTLAGLGEAATQTLLKTQEEEQHILRILPQHRHVLRCVRQP